MQDNFVNFAENDYQCPICYESFAFAIRLNEHSEMHFGKNTIKKEIEENSAETFAELVPVYRIKHVSFDNVKIVSCVLLFMVKITHRLLLF